MAKVCPSKPWQRRLERPAGQLFFRSSQSPLEAP